MKRLFSIGMTLCFIGALGYADSFSGKLVDASCIDKSSPGTPTGTADRKTREKTAESCAPTGATSTFAVQTSNGKLYRLDSAGNQKAAAAMQSGTLKSDKDGDVHVSVSGSMQGDSLQVDSIVSGKGHK